MKNDLTEWLTIREAARKLNITVRTIQRQISKRSVKATKLGHTYAISSDQLALVKGRPAHRHRKLSQ